MRQRNVRDRECADSTGTYCWRWKVKEMAQEGIQGRNTHDLGER
jgi:hypothetical protein